MKNAREEIEGVLVDRHRDLMVYAIHLCHNPDFAEDLVQSAAVRSLSKTHLYIAGTNAFGWVRIILRNEYFRIYRRRQALAAPVQLTDEDIPASIPAPQESRVLWVEVVAALKGLSKEQRQAVMDIAFGYSYEETALKEGCLLGTAKSRVSRGRSGLKEFAV